MNKVKNKNNILKLYVSIIQIFICSTILNAQLIKIDNNDEYTKVLIDRVDAFLPDIIEKSDTGKYLSVRNSIIKQYIDLSTIHDKRDNDIIVIEGDASLDASGKSNKIDLVRLESENEIYILHAEYLGRLSPLLSLDQIDKVKNGVTYSVFPST